MISEQVWLFLVGCIAINSCETLGHPDISSNDVDFIIVGGGTAGGVLANRLTENGQYNVLLIEAGGYPNPELDIPATFSRFLNDTRYVKIYRSVPQRDASLVNNGVVGYIVGRVLGGSSQLNAMYFNRGSPLDYDNWARITGDSSWSYSSLMKYFRRIEDYEGDFHSGEQHGYGGPITISRPRYAPLLEEWAEAGRYLGYRYADPNGPQMISFAPNEFNKRFGRRVSSYTGYIKPILGLRPNLQIITHAEVNKVLFEGNRAVGVVYRMLTSSGRFNSPQRIARARKEIILSAGSIASSAILMRSGVGPRDVLQASKIPVVKYLPVGLNLHDHPIASLDFIINNRSAVFIPERDLNPETLRYYNSVGDGPYSCYAGITTQAFLASSLAGVDWDDGTIGDRNWPDIQLLTVNSPGSPGVVSAPSNRNSYVLRNDEVVINSGFCGGRPKSRGRITLNVTNPEGDPLIDFRYYENLDDMQVMLEGLKATLRIYEDTPTFQRLGARLPPNPHPGCLNIPFRSDNYWRCLIRQQTASIMHLVSTCPMGRERDPRTVVDSRLKVIGLENLRVCDGSVMPQVINANTQAPVYVIAEKTADVILQRWTRPRSSKIGARSG